MYFAIQTNIKQTLANEGVNSGDTRKNVNQLSTQKPQLSLDRISTSCSDAVCILCGLGQFVATNDSSLRAYSGSINVCLSLTQM